MFKIAIFLLICMVGVSSAISIRSLGMGDVYPVTARDPSGIFCNPAYLAKADGVRLSIDNINGPIAPWNNIALSVGDLGLASSTSNQGSAYYIAQGFNVYSFLRLGVGIKILNDRRDFDLGLDLDITKNLEISAASLNEDNSVFQRKQTLAVAYKTEDWDKCFVLSYDLKGQASCGYENQFTPKAFWRVGYKVDHPTAGLTLPLNQHIDADLAFDMARENPTLTFGLELFRNTENKRRNTNHSLNFGKAIAGEDKFIEIEGYNIHYVEAGQGHPLVLIGGGIHTTHHWDPYLKEFAARYRVINIDHVGAAESDKPQYFFNYTIEEQAEIINELLDTIGIKEAYLLGYSYGGSIALYLAGNYPDKYRKVIAIEGFVRGINTISLDDRYRQGAVALRHDIEYLNAYLVKDFVTSHYRFRYPYFNYKTWYQLNRSVLYADYREEVRNIKGPVLYYLGTKSWAYDFLRPTREYIEKNIKDLKLIVVEGADHDVDRYDQAKFLEQVLEFLGKEQIK